MVFQSRRPVGEDAYARNRYPNLSTYLVLKCVAILWGKLAGGRTKTADYQMYRVLSITTCNHDTD